MPAKRAESSGGEMNEELLRELIEEAKVSHAWMLKSIKGVQDDMSANYSNELRHAINVQIALEAVE